MRSLALKLKVTTCFVCETLNKKVLEITGMYGRHIFFYIFKNPCGGYLYQVAMVILLLDNIYIYISATNYRYA